MDWSKKQLFSFVSLAIFLKIQGFELRFSVMEFFAIQYVCSMYNSRCQWIGLCLVVISMASCTMEKRLYTSGFHIQWNGKISQGNNTESIKNKTERVSKSPNVQTKNNNITWEIKNSEQQEKKKGKASIIAVESANPCFDLNNVGLNQAIAPMIMIREFEKSIVIYQSDVSINCQNKSLIIFQKGVGKNWLSAPRPILPPDSLAIKKIANLRKTVNKTALAGSSLYGVGWLLIFLDPVKYTKPISTMTFIGVLVIFLSILLVMTAIWLRMSYLAKRRKYNRNHNPGILK